MTARGGFEGGTPVSRAWWVHPRTALGLVFLLFLLLRAPSWFEPHWYTDEGGYATTAWLAMHGGTLYSTVWNNKPPLLFWSYGLVLTLFGPSELGLHLMSTLLGLIALAGLWKLARDLMGRPRALVAVLLAALALGLPILNAELALPESLLIAPATWGMVATMAAVKPGGNRFRWLWAVTAGALFAAAILYQQTALADTAAAALWLWLLPAGRGRRPMVALVVATAILVGAALAPYLIWAGPSNVFYFLVLSYKAYAQASVGPSLATIVPRGVVLLAIPLGALWGRREPDQTWRLVWIWLAVTALTAALPNRPYIFFTIPLVIPLALLLARAPLPVGRRLSGLGGLVRRRGGVVLAGLLACSMWGQILATEGGLASYTTGLTMGYYQNFAAHALGQKSQVSYENYFDYRVAAERQAALWIDEHGLRGQTALLWSSDAWAYLLADVHPAVPTPALYVDEMWLGSAGVMDWVEAKRPVVVVTTPSSLQVYPQIVPYLEQFYVEVYHPYEAQVWVRRGHVPKGVSPLGS
ncbi:MAG: ArnT family glycosyltransferase [Candidatus Dormibacteria bacterium]